MFSYLGLGGLPTRVRVTREGRNGWLNRRHGRGRCKHRAGGQGWRSDYHFSASKLMNELVGKCELWHRVHLDLEGAFPQLR